MSKALQWWQIVLMVGGIVAASFGAFKWIDSQQDADTSQAARIDRAEMVHENDSLWRVEVLDEIQELGVVMDSVYDVSKQNQEAINMNRVSILLNRSTIVKQIESDTSLSREETIEMLQELYDGIEDLKKNSPNGPYAYE